MDLCRIDAAIAMGDDVAKPDGLAERANRFLGNDSVFVQTLEGFPVRRRGLPALVADQMSRQINAGLDCEEEVERDQVQSIARQAFETGGAELSDLRDPLCELLQLLSDDVPVNHGASPPRRAF